MGNIDEIPMAVDEAVRSIESMDIRMNATIDIEDQQLKQSEGVIKAIEDALEEIDRLKVEPITPEAMAMIKQYRKEVETLISKWGALQKQGLSTRQLSMSAFSTQQPDLYQRYQATSGIKPQRQKEEKSNLGKIGATVAKATIGVRSLYFAVRKIVSNNEKLSAAVQYATEVVAAGLKPVLDFIASLIIGFFGILSRLFNIQVGIGKSSAATASNTEKALTIASFDELDVLNSNRDGGAGVSGGYGGYLDEINKKLERVYGIIDKIRAWVKDNLPGGKYTTETGVPRVAEESSQKLHGGTSSLGFNLVPDGQGGLIDLYEIEQNAEKMRTKLENIKAWWASLKENVRKHNEEIAQNTIQRTDAQVEAWNKFKEGVKTKWDELKGKIFGDNTEIANSNSMLSTSALQAWETLKQGAKNKWQEIKNKIFGDNAEIAQNNLSLSDILSNAWENIKLKASEKWEGLKTTINTKIEDIKTKIKSVPEALKDWASAGWTAVKNFGNNIIAGIESAINNVIWKINNSGVATALNKVFGGGFQLGTIYIPRLAKGGVLSTPTIAQLGEYPGARSNPEIATPQSLLKETIDASNGELATVFAQGIRQIISAIDNKDLEVNISDTTIAKSAARGNRQWQLQTGGSLF